MGTEIFLLPQERVDEGRRKSYTCYCLIGHLRSALARAILRKSRDVRKGERPEGDEGGRGGGGGVRIVP